MNMINSKNALFAMLSVGACATTAVIAQISPEPACFTNKFLRMACDNLAQESDPECNDVILDGDDDPVLETETTEGCGQVSRARKQVKCVRAVYVFNTQTGSCDYSHNHEDYFTSNEASGDPCGAC